jgi:hypothetical protein
MLVRLSGTLVAGTSYDQKGKVGKICGGKSGQFMGPFNGRAAY